MDRSRLTRFINLRLAEFPLVQPIFVSPADTARTAVARMQNGSHSCVLGGDASNLVGIFTERDVLTRCTEDGFDWDAPLEDHLLTLQPQTIASTCTVGEAIAVMQQHHYRTLPVVEGGRVIGVIRLGDLLRHLAEAFPEDVLNLPPRPHQVMEKQEGG